jgi:hypothetical protein
MQQKKLEIKLRMLLTAITTNYDNDQINYLNLYIKTLYAFRAHRVFLLGKMHLFNSSVSISLFYHVGPGNYIYFMYLIMEDSPELSPTPFPASPF